MSNLISLLMGYVLGCFQTAYLVARMAKSIDIREHGSGNAGSTNAMRVLGWRYGLLTFMGDFSKAVIAVAIARVLFDSQLAGFYAGLGVVVGHNWPVVLGFKGGKGIASTLGILMAYDWRIGLFVWIVGALIIYLTRYVSLASMIMISLAPVCIAVLYPGAYHALALAFILAALGIYRHRGNIRRLLNGTENRIGQKKL